MIERLIDRLQQAGLTLTYEEIADALWLAERIDAPATPDLAAQPKRDDDPSRVTLGPIEPGPQDTAPQDIDGMPLFAADAIGTTPDEAGEAETAEPAGLPLSVPAASALPNAIDLSRALRDLMRKVPSQTRFELDEAATVDQIAIQRVRYPVVKPELERWLDLELVIEESDTSFIWRKTVEAFRKKVLEKLGAFRTLRTWRLQADDRGQLQLWPYLPDKIPTPGQPHQALKPRSPKALQASERRLIVLVSDCRSSLWQQRPQARRANAKEKPTWVLYDWLQQWAAKGPTAVLQVLPERLWEKTELGYGDPVQFSARLPGVTNTHLVTDEMTAWVSDEPAPHRARPLPLPVITLDAKPLKRWAQVVAGVGNTRTPGYWFDVGLLHQYPSDSDEDSASRSVEARVNRFFASASPTAQSLARLMAAAPVSLSVVYLIRETMLPQAKPVHIAEVFISDLLHPTGRSTATGEPIYDFYTGVRERIVQLSDPDLTLQVFARLTDKIGEEIGDAINSFDALLAPKPEWLTASDAVAPFAAVTSQVLRVLGGDYAALLET
ncbi:MAG: SAV_2336 N-terminal domain-related protein, partial [Cyanobacteria bacterium J06632_22]